MVSSFDLLFRHPPLLNWARGSARMKKWCALEWAKKQPDPCGGWTSSLAIAVSHIKSEIRQNRPGQNSESFPSRKEEEEEGKGLSKGGAANGPIWLSFGRFPRNP